MKRRPPTGIVPARNLHLQMLADRMRPDEREHFQAMTGDAVYDPELAARAMMLSTGIKIAYLDCDGMPVMAGGWSQERGSCWSGWMVNTEHGWRHHWRGITKAATWFIEDMLNGPAQRLQITTLASREAARDWYERALGFSLDGILRGAGARGEDLVIYSRLKV